jgi:hypothetical protein
MYAAAWQRANKNPGGKGTAKKRGDATDCNLANSSTHAAAEKFNVSARGVSQAVVVIEEGCPQLQQAVRDGRVNVTLAAASAVGSHALHNAPTFADDNNVAGLQLTQGLCPFSGDGGRG